MLASEEELSAPGVGLGAGVKVIMLVGGTMEAVGSGAGTNVVSEIKVAVAEGFILLLLLLLLLVLLVEELADVDVGTAASGLERVMRVTLGLLASMEEMRAEAEAGERVMVVLKDRRVVPEEDGMDGGVVETEAGGVVVSGARETLGARAGGRDGATVIWGMERETEVVLALTAVVVVPLLSLPLPLLLLEGGGEVGLGEEAVTVIVTVVVGSLLSSSEQSPSSSPSSPPVVEF